MNGFTVPVRDTRTFSLLYYLEGFKSQCQRYFVKAKSTMVQTVKFYWSKGPKILWVQRSKNLKVKGKNPEFQNKILTFA